MPADIMSACAPSVVIHPHHSLIQHGLQSENWCKHSHTQSWEKRIKNIQSYDLSSMKYNKPQNRLLIENYLYFLSVCLCVMITNLSLCIENK